MISIYGQRESDTPCATYHQYLLRSSSSIRILTSRIVSSAVPAIDKLLLRGYPPILGQDTWRYFLGQTEERFLQWQSLHYAFYSVAD